MENPPLLPWALLSLPGSGNEVGVAGKKDKVTASLRNQAEKKNKSGKGLHRVCVCVCVCVSVCVSERKAFHWQLWLSEDLEWYQRPLEM